MKISKRNQSKASMIFYSLIFIFFLSFHCNSVNGEIYRLPKNIHPIRYNLTIEILLEPDISSVPYNGSVAIQLSILENTDKITLHKRKLKIQEDSISVVDLNGINIGVTSTSESESDETYTIHLDKELEKEQNYTLTIGNFYNKLGNHKVGFYLAKYTDPNGIRRRLAITDFEPTDARQAFPCFDEPAIKSKFIINVIRKKEHHTVSNEELETSIDLGDGRFKDTFKETPYMPVYIVAFVVSDHKSTKRVEKQRIFARADDIERGSMDYALEISGRVLKQLEEYTGIDFPLRKLDQFAVPDNYFKDDAMENWGLIIYGESHLMCTNTSAAVDLKRCISYISHEFAHQWFGNLVTPEWWDYTWLSESFAAYFQYYIASKVQPEWRLMDLFIIDNVHNGFANDDHYDRSRPLTHPIKSSGEFPPLDILYYKGSSIIRMVEHFLTSKVSQQGLQNYLRDRQYKSATPSDLYKALQKAADDANLLGNHSVADILTTWETNKGFPIVTVTRNYTTGSITFKQDQYTTTRKKLVRKPWYIPINYAFQSDDQHDFSNTTANFWLTEIEKTVDGNFPKDGWLIVNKQQTGYYRVNYDDENWERIISFMKSEHFKTIHALNRAYLIDDAFNFAGNGWISFDVPIRLCDYLVQERDYIPFAAFYNAISRVRSAQMYEAIKKRSTTNSVSTLSDKELYQEYVKDVLNGIREHLGFEAKPTDTFLDRFNRPSFTYFLCRYHDPQCVKYAEDKLKEVKEKKISTVSPDLEIAVYSSAVGGNKATEEEWDALFHVYNTSTDIHQRRRLRDVLGRHTLSYTKSLF